MSDKKEVATRPQIPQPWPSRWKAPAMMLLSMLAGLAFGVGHHAYYQSLNGTEVQSTKQQQWAIRIATGLAFLTKSASTIVAGIAFSQYFWVIARRKAMPLQSLDAMFAMDSNLMSFFDGSVLAHAKILTAIGITLWLLPLVALVPPATLTVESRVTQNITSHMVPYPVFETPDANETSFNIWSDYMGVGWVKTASPALTRLLTAVASGMAIIPVSSPYPNSSYSMQFYGPCLKCQYFDDALQSADLDSKSLKSLYPDIETTSLEKIRKQLEGQKEFYGLGDQDFCNAAFDEMYNVIFVEAGVAEQNITTSIVCQFRNASYNVDLRFYENSAPSTTISSLELEPPLKYGTYTARIGYLPLNGARAYMSMMRALMDLLSGSVGYSFGLSSGGGVGINNTFASTGLLACPEIVEAEQYNEGATRRQFMLNVTTSPWMCRNGSLRKAIEDLSQNFTLSLMSTALYTERRATDVTSFTSRNFFLYQPKSLAISYLVALGVGLACLVTGSWAVFVNGYSASTSFSTILQTTRNRELDSLVASSEGRETLPRKVELQYGIFQDADGGDRVAFGPAEKVTLITKEHRKPV